MPKQKEVLSIFNKKHYLVDQLYGLVDIHNHILPGIDDGAKNINDSIEIIKGFAEFGVKNFICTPHIIQGYYNNTPRTIKAAHKKLKSVLEKVKIQDITLDYAAEHMVDGYFEDLLEEVQIMPLRKYYLLVEMSFLQAPFNFDSAIGKIIAAGYFPILAHPERYVFLHKNFEKYHYFKQKNILLQVNLLSLTGYYGNDIRNIAFKLIDMGMVNFLASDIHNHRQLDFIKECTLSGTALKKIPFLINNTIETFW